MKTRNRALADYIRKWGCFPCGERVLPDASNTQFSREYDRHGNPRWRLRCLNCNRAYAAEAMAKLRRRQRKETR